MDSDTWSDRLASASRRYQLDFLSRSEGEGDFREEYACPFCSEYFDIVSLCCHIDEDHPMDAKNEVCPVCAVKVSSDLVSHITLQHADMFKVTRKRKSRRGEAQSMLSILKREFLDGNYQSLFEGSSHVSSSSSNVDVDPLLFSFISPMSDDFCNSKSHLSSSANKTLSQSLPERSVEKQKLSAEDHREKLKQSEFSQGILSSMILDDGL